MDSFTKFMYDMATSPQLTLHEAVESLRKNAYTRTVRDALANATGIPPEDRSALQAVVTNALMRTAPSAKRESISRKVRMWLADDMRFVRKESAIQLCFALELPLKESENLMYRLCGEGFHWRDPRDIVFICARMWGQTYEEATVLLNALKADGLLESDTVDSAENYTGEVRELIRQITSLEELKLFLRENRQKFGAFHNTAYQLFTGFLDILSEPRIDDQLQEDEKFSIRSIMRCYFYEQFIPRLEKAAKGDKQVEESVLSALQEDIRQNWPDEMTISRMAHRKVDVTRKVLILLFLATDGGLSDYADMGDDCDYDSYADELEGDTGPGQDFEDMYWRMNSMLIECGFAPLDSRAPFDWMILYCMCADDSVFIDGRMQRFLRDLFPASEATPDLRGGESDWK